VGPLPPMQEISFNFAVEDPNVGDQLTARTFQLISGATADMGTSTTLDFMGFDIPVTFPSLPDPNNPTRRFGQTPLLRCESWAKSNTTDVFIIVTDRAFSSAEPDKV